MRLQNEMAAQRVKKKNKGLDQREFHVIYHNPKEGIDVIIILRITAFIKFTLFRSCDVNQFVKSQTTKP